MFVVGHLFTKHVCTHKHNACLLLCLRRTFGGNQILKVAAKGCAPRGPWKVQNLRCTIDEVKSSNPCRTCIEGAARVA